jgi:hypothetical protein
MKNNYLTAFLLAISAFLLSACGTTPVAVGLIEKPAQPTTAVRVLYIESRLSTGNDILSPTASNTLYRLGYFDIGEKIKNLAPGMLVKRGISADAATMREEVFVGGGYRELKANYSDGKPFRVLILHFTKGQSTNYGGAGAVLNLQAAFRDVQNNKLYWKGEYRNSVKQSLFGSVIFDDKFVGEMLNQVFSDMEKFELIPVAKPGQPLNSQNAAR